MSCLYILEIKPLSVASFANIFSHFVGCLFVLLMVSYAVQKILSLIRSNLFIFGFIFITLGGANAFFFLAALGLRCCMQAFSSCSEWGLLFVAVRELPIVVPSLLLFQSTGSRHAGFSNCGMRAQ